MTADWQEVVTNPDIDVVFIATTHDVLPLIAEQAASHGKHVLVEKPAARRAAELEPVKAAAARTGALIRVGFNHRYHRAFRQARQIVDAGALGPLMFCVPAMAMAGGRLRQGVAGGPGSLGRRRADRSGGSSDRSGALVPG